MPVTVCMISKLKMDAYPTHDNDEQLFRIYMNGGQTGIGWDGGTCNISNNVTTK